MTNTNRLEELETEVERLKAENVDLSAKLKIATEALDEINDHCVCERGKTKGFDYGERHKRLGKPRTGARWLTARDISKGALARIQARGEEKGKE